MSAMCNADYECPVKFQFVNEFNNVVAEVVDTVGEIVQGAKRSLDLQPAGLL